MTTSPQPPPGLTVGGYSLLSRLGEGGMGVVHLARRPGGERVALKVLRPHIVGDDEARARLAREVSSLTRVRSRWVAEIVDSDPWGDIPYVATRYVPGLSLHERVQEMGPIEGDDLRWLARGLAEGIATVHAVGVLHRDVKPSNVLMEGRNPILIDFGLARVADDPRITHTGWLLGTPGYLAPEILHGDDAGPASDLHSWAATVAYAGTGRPPFGRGPSMAIMDRVRRGQHDLSGLPEDLAAVLDAALDPDPARRPDLPTLLGWLREPHRVPMPTVVEEVRLPGREDVRTVPLALGEQPPVERVPVLERIRRGALLVGVAVAVAGGIAAYPWLATSFLLLLMWLLRSASLAASATRDRRRLRGARWYDPVVYLAGAPWHVVRAIPGTALLALWSLGLGVSAALISYAAAAGVEATLFFSGLVFAVSLWSGPGGSRVRSPLARVVRPLAVSPTTWLAALAVVLGAAAVLGYLALDRGVDWAPHDSAPFSDVHWDLLRS